MKIRMFPTPDHFSYPIQFKKDIRRTGGFSGAHFTFNKGLTAHQKITPG
jgi:hypothetical protein